MPVILEFRDATSQFTSQSVLAGSPPSAKLLIPVTSERAVSPRASRTGRGLSRRFSGETSRARERVGSLRATPSDQMRRDVRVVEGARLESVCRGNSTVGSNPTLSAIHRRSRSIQASYGGWLRMRAPKPWRRRPTLSANSYFADFLSNLLNSSAKTVVECHSS